LYGFGSQIWLNTLDRVNLVRKDASLLRGDLVALPTATARIEPKDQLALQKDLLALEKDLNQTENAVRTTLFQLFASVAQFVVGLAVFGTLYFTWRNSNLAQKQFIQTTILAQQAQADTRFHDIHERLESEDATVRAHAIFRLAEMAKERAPGG